VPKTSVGAIAGPRTINGDATSELASRAVTAPPKAGAPDTTPIVQENYQCAVLKVRPSLGARDW
jgi:hypothetical protein